MTEKLRELMHDRATAARFDPPDLDRLVQQGDRALRRRRALTGAVGLAAAAAVGIGAVTAFGGPNDQPGSDEVASPSANNTVPTYADGSVIHNGPDTIDVGVPVKAFVRTAVGYVVADPSGAVLSVVGGSVAEVGRVDPQQIRLVSDPDGALAGWVDLASGSPAAVVLDQEQGSMTALTTEGTPKKGLYVFAVDGSTTYVLDSRGAVAIDVDSADTIVVKADTTDPDDLVDAEAGRIAFYTEGEGLRVGPSFAAADLRLDSLGGGPGVFSPDGKFISLDEDSPDVYEVATGRKLAFTGTSDYFSYGYEWLDESTLLMGSYAKAGAPLDLLSCAVPAGDCRPVLEDVGAFEKVLDGTVTVPIGVPVEP